jgi:phosphatidyl-myo-inositol dimannoside synthase
VSERVAVRVAAQYLRPGNGGIAEVARVTTKALVRGGATSALACLEPSDFDIEGAPVRAYRGSRARFVLGLETASLAPSRFLYDFAGTARSARLLFPRRPYAVWAHGIEVWDDVRADRRAALERADVVLVNSGYTRARGEPTLGKLPNVRICGLGAYGDAVAERSGPSQGPPTVLLLGRLETGLPKGQGVLISLARASSAAASIEVAGFVPEAAIEAIWARATLFAMPSLTEGFGLVFIEAMRRGLPVIASRADAGAEVNVDGATGYTIDRDKPGGVVEAIVELLRDRDRAAMLGAAGQTRWRAEFCFSAFAGRLEAALADFHR